MPDTTKKILYVEDDEGLAYLLRKRLDRYGFVVDVAETGEKALLMHEQNKYRIILLDYTLPTISGMDVLKKIAPVDSNPIVIMLTASGNEMLALEALEHGAEDYVLKDAGARYLDLLPHVLNAAIRKAALHRQNKEQQESLQFYISKLEAQNALLQKEIEDRTALETELRHAKSHAEDASLAKTEFLANMSHEIRTPMNSVVGITSILCKDKSLGEQSRKHIAALKDSSDNLMALISDLLDISKIEANTMDLETISISIHDIVESVISILEPRAAEKGLSFKRVFELGASSLHIGDPTRLRQIILNLCSNAVKFTSHGEITILLSMKESPYVQGRDVLEFAVTDTGIGIEQSKMETIFDKFMQADTSISRRFGGTGLGLAITKSLVDKMNGKIHAESELGKGTTFKVYLEFDRAAPVAYTDAAVIDDDMKNDISGVPPAMYRVLLVEDYEPNVVVAGYFLEQFCCNYDVAQNGQEALEKFGETRYNAILMDVQMPLMDGYTATTKIRAMEAETGADPVPIIGMTANALVGDKEKCFACGMNDYISKPFSPDELKSKLYKHFLKKEENICAP